MNADHHPAQAPDMLSSMDLGERMQLQYRVEQFLYAEAQILDERRYERWLELLTDDIHYWMPIRRTTTVRGKDLEFTRPGEMAFFDDDLEMLKRRVTKLTAPNSWAEDPPSRTRHFVSNIQLTSVRSGDVLVTLNFQLHRSRMDSEEDCWIGARHDTLRPTGETFLLARRHVFLDQTVILAQNMSNLF